MNAATFLRLVSPGTADEASGDCPSSHHITGADALANAKAALVRRRFRARLFGELRFADGPGWEMLVDLYISQCEGKSLCIGSLCVTSGVPMTNAVRVLAKLLDSGLVHRVPDPADRRRCMIALGDNTRAKLDLYFESF